MKVVAGFRIGKALVSSIGLIVKRPSLPRYYSFRDKVFYQGITMYL